MRNLTLVFAFAALLLSGAPVFAHAQLDRAEPRVGSSVRASPREVTLWFTEKLEPAFSSATVRNAAGARVDAGKARASGNVMRVPLKSLPPGTYTVSWRVLSADTHTTQGEFSFTVGQ